MCFIKPVFSATTTGGAIMNNEQKLNILRTNLEDLYMQRNDELLFHGWHHITFILKKSIDFANSIGADLFLVESAALTHDLNYVVKENSVPEVGAELRKQCLSEAGYTQKEIERIENIVLESHTGYRTEQISDEGRALSDADSLFKILPITPVIFSGKYITQNKVDISKLANKIVTEQNKLMDQGIYFYTALAKEKYLKWARINLNLWNGVVEALRDEDVQALLRMTKSIEAGL
jgi:uncharacterized protein